MGMYVRAQRTGLMTIDIHHGDGKRKTRQMELSRSTTLLAAMQKAATVYEIVSSIDNTKDGPFLRSLDGEDTTKTGGWICFVNGEFPKTAISNVVLRAGDTVQWRFVEGNLDHERNRVSFVQE